jgi:hypothetical protein
MLYVRFFTGGDQEERTDGHGQKFVFVHRSFFKDFLTGLTIGKSRCNLEHLDNHPVKTVEENGVSILRKASMTEM